MLRNGTTELLKVRMGLWLKGTLLVLWGVQKNISVRGMVKNLPLLRRAGDNGCPWVHAIMCDNTYSDICMIIHASTL